MIRLWTKSPEWFNATQTIAQSVKKKGRGLHCFADKREHRLLQSEEFN